MITRPYYYYYQHHHHHYSDVINCLVLYFMFVSFTHAHFVIGPLAVELACKYIGNELNYYCIIIIIINRDSSVDIATGYILGGRGSISGKGRDFSLFRSVQTRSGAHPTSCPRSTGEYFPGGKAAGAWRWPLTFISAEVKNGGALPPLPHTSSWHGA
jgi:hypothetical protein